MNIRLSLDDLARKCQASEEEYFALQRRKERCFLVMIIVNGQD